MDVTKIQTKEGVYNIVDANFREYMKRGYLIISDSYGNTANNFITYLKQFLKYDKFFNKSTGGSAFGNTSPNPTFQEDLQSMVNSLTTDEKSYVTDILIVGGRNDANNTYSNISTGISACKDLLTNFPNLKNAYIVCAGWDRDFTIRGKLFTTYSSYMTLGIANGFTVVDNIYCVLTNKAYTESDGVHPTQSGSYAIAESIANALNGGEIVNNNQVYTMYANSSNIADVIQINKTIYVKFLQVLVNVNSISVTGTKIIENVNTAILEGGAAYINYPVIAIGNGSSGFSKKDIAIYFLENSSGGVDVYAKSLDINSSGAYTDITFTGGFYIFGKIIDTINHI